MHTHILSTPNSSNPWAQKSDPDSWACRILRPKQRCKPYILILDLLLSNHVIIEIYIYIYVLLLSPAHSAQTFFLWGAQEFVVGHSGPYSAMRMHGNLTPNHCVLLGGCLSKSYVKRWVIRKRLLEERLLTLVQDNK